MTHDTLQYCKQLARAANARGDDMMVGTIIGLNLEPLFGDDHAAAHRFYTELEHTFPNAIYGPIKEDRNSFGSVKAPFKNVFCATVKENTNVPENVLVNLRRDHGTRLQRSACTCWGVS